MVVLVVENFTNECIALVPCVGNVFVKQRPEVFLGENSDSRQSQREQHIDGRETFHRFSSKLLIKRCLKPSPVGLVEASTQSMV